MSRVASRERDWHESSQNLYSPAAMVGYFDDLSAAIMAKDTDAADLHAIASRHGMEVAGSVPEGYL